MISSAHADLEWITGGVPKNTQDKSTGAVVRDAPAEETHNTVTGNQDILVSLLTTCTKIVNQYPADSVNYFYLNKNNQISYFAYFLMKPTSRIHTATVEWFNPANIRIAKYDQEYRVSFTDRLLTVQNDTYQWFLLDMTLGMDHMNPQVGQNGLPRDVGLYSIRLSVDGQLVGVSFFYVKSEDSKQASPMATAAPTHTMSQSNPMPLSTPFSSVPIQKRIP